MDTKSEAMTASKGASAVQIEPMGKNEFLGKLSYYLRDLPPDQVSDAIGYYQSYLSDVGPANEAKAIAEIGSPESVANKIRANAGEPPVDEKLVAAVQEAPTQQAEVPGVADEAPQSGEKSSFFERHDAADPKPQKNVNPYSKKNYYEEHGLPKPERKVQSGTEAGSSEHKGATVLGIAALILCFAWIPILIVLIVLGFTFAAIPTAIAMLVGGLILFAKGRG